MGSHSRLIRSRTGCVGGQSKKRSAEPSHSGSTRSRTGCVGGQSKKRSAEPSHSGSTRSRTFCVGGQSKKRSAEPSHSGSTRSRTRCVGGQSKKRSAEPFHSGSMRSRTPPTPCAMSTDPADDELAMLALLPATDTAAAGSVIDLVLSRFAFCRNLGSFDVPYCCC